MAAAAEAVAVGDDSSMSSSIPELISGIAISSMSGITRRFWRKESEDEEQKLGKGKGNYMHAQHKHKPSLPGNPVFAKQLRNTRQLEKIPLILHWCLLATYTAQERATDL